ncbi:hypothetical protein QR90_08320 [Deinococcus radiopugnans]|uniref:Uncharacterized protein n=1 Tax=Deinococcus radiopugnans TaxID=57497 RepID=A0A0A7KKM7_9DEIO|nr:hypothetical protein QR90_08320 [Deinococcus radiopugnans]
MVDGQDSPDNHYLLEMTCSPWIGAHTQFIIRNNIVESLPFEQSLSQPRHQVKLEEFFAVQVSGRQF